MRTLKTIRFLSLFGTQKDASDVFRLLSLSTVLLLITTLLAPTPIDMIYILLIESLCFVVIMLLSFFFTLHIGIIFLGLLMSVILVPLLLMFLYVALMMITMMLGFEVLAEEVVRSPYPLINHSVMILDGNYEEGIWSMLSYFGTDLYWIVGGIVLHHLVFDLYQFYQTYKKNKEQKDYDWRMDMFYHFTFKALTQSTIIMFFGLVMAVPVLIIVLFFSTQLWLIYVVVILLRIAVEWFEKEMGTTTKVLTSSPK